MIDFIARLTRSFDEDDADLVGGDPLAFDGYAEQLESARASTGLAEACVWGLANIDGERCALVAMDFAFLGGSMGVAVGEKVARAFDAAARRRTPIVTVCASGGARMQEGMVALSQMAKVSEAKRRHAAAGLGHVTLLTSPTTGGVYASFASLADVILAEPHATVGFAGPRVVEELTGTQPPPEMHSAEYALEHGLVDAIVAPGEEQATIGRVLRGLRPTTASPRPGSPKDRDAAPSELTAWERLEIVRDAARPKAPAILDTMLDDAFELRGDGQGSDDGSVVVRLGALRVSRRRVLAIGEDASGDGRIRPEGFRKVIRAFEIAGRLGLPVVTLIDTRGADPLPGSEGHGIASAVSHTFVAMLDCPSPTLAVVTGEGGSGGALAMTVADRVIAWENAVFSVIAPEGAASILYRDAERAPELADRLGITAADLVELGIVDRIVPEPSGGAQTDPHAAIEDLSSEIEAEIEHLAGLRPKKRRVARARRWRGAGNEYIQHGSR